MLLPPRPFQDAPDSSLPPPPAPPLPQPVYLHGSLGREAATGRGTMFAIRELLKVGCRGKGRCYG